MIFTITAAVGEDYTLTAAQAQGYIGESNAELLAIDLGPFAQEGFDCYYLHFDTSAFGGRFSSDPVTAAEGSPARLEGTTLCCPLTERLTATGRLRVQLEGQKTENGKRTIKKTSVITLYFRPSIQPADAALGESGYDRLAQTEAALTALQTALAAQTQQLTAMQAQLDAIDAAPQQASVTLPAATADTLGGVKVAQTNPVCTDADGRLTVNECALDWKLTTSLFIASLLNYNSALRVLIDDGSAATAQVANQFETFNMNVIDGYRTALVFVTARNLEMSYLDENYEPQAYHFVKGNFYLLRMQDDAVTLENMAGETLRQLLLSGI